MDKEIVKKARQANLVAYLLNRGEKIKKTGNYWEHKTHNSLVFKDNMFYWNSRQEKGNSVDFLMLFYGYDFRQAVEELTNTKFEEVELADGRANEEEFRIEYADNAKRLIAYLVQKRRVDYKIVTELLQKKLIAQDKRGNIVFKIYDETNVLVGAEMVGSGDQRFKGVAGNTKNGYGFSIKAGIPRYLFFFESPIDLISFYEIKREKVRDCVLVSLSGLKENIFVNMVNVSKVDISNTFLCVDNDNAGQEFINIIKSKYEGVRAYLPPKEFKDWNEHLIDKKKQG